MAALKSLCVYCSASVKVDQEYLDVARDMGRLMAKEGLRLVYGGAHIGMMGAISDGVLEQGGKVLGVTTDYIGAHEGMHEKLTELHIVDTMHDRKCMMFEEADAFAVLPGGFGTLDEFFETLTWKQLGLHSKPIVLINHKGFWDPLKNIMDSLKDGHFIGSKDQKLCSFVDNIEDVIPMIRSMPNAKVDPTEKWGKK